MKTSSTDRNFRVLKHGLKVHSFILGEQMYKVNAKNVKSITVSMEIGEYNLAPWLVVRFEDESRAMINTKFVSVISID